MRIKLFMDTEFTGLHKNTTLISIGIISEYNNIFYAEFTDYDKSQIDNWLQKNVIDNLLYNDIGKNSSKIYKENNGYYSIRLKGDTKYVKDNLIEWLDQFKNDVEIWSDCLAYDWVLFCELFGGALKLPKNIYYIPFDISTVFKIKGIDPDVSRCEFLEFYLLNHNSLNDAKIIKGCYDKLKDFELKFLKGEI